MRSFIRSQLNYVLTMAGILVVSAALRGLGLMDEAD
jgi:hypothetical protein